VSVPTVELLFGNKARLLKAAIDVAIAGDDDAVPVLDRSWTHNIETEHHHGPVADPDGPVGSGVLLWFGVTSDFDGVVARAAHLKTTVVRPPHRNPPEGQGNAPGHREIWLRDADGYTVVVASPDGEATSRRHRAA
jgi:hypothetical protein